MVESLEESEIEAKRERHRVIQPAKSGLIKRNRENGINSWQV